MDNANNDYTETGLNLALSGKNQEALNYLDQHGNGRSDSGLSWRVKGFIYHRNREYPKALRAYEQAIALDPADGFAWSQKANALRRLGEYEAGLAAYDRAIELGSEGVAPWKGKAKIYYDTGQYELALNAYEQAIGIKKGEMSCWQGIGDCLYLMSRYAEALDAYEQALRINASLAAPWSGKGHCLSQMGYYEEALQSYEQAIGRDPKAPCAWYGKARVHAVWENPDPARTCLFHAYRLSGFQEIQAHLPLFLQVMDERETPLFYHRLMSDHPQLRTHSDWAEIFEELDGDIAPARTLLERLADDPTLSGLFAYAMGDPFYALQRFEQRVRRYPADLMARYYQIRSKEKLRWDQTLDLEYGVSRARQLMESEGESRAMAFYYAGRILFMDGNFSLAQAAFDRAWTADSTPIAALYMQMLCFHRMGNFREKAGRIRIILQKERELKEAGNSGFLGRIGLKTPPGRSQTVSALLGKYVHAVELSEALAVVYDWLAAYEQKHGALPRSLSFAYDRQPLPAPLSLARAWLQDRPKGKANGKSNGKKTKVAGNGSRRGKTEQKSI
jgi:tetratricopeptide (TPR) repeat protein